MQLILASSSPRRKELLALLGLAFEVCPPDVDEQPTAGWSPITQVTQFALAKARGVAQVQREAFVLGCDTVIELDGQLLGKPRDLDEARTMLALLAGRSHLVHTAVVLCHRDRGIESMEVATTGVQMKADDGQCYERYLATGESLGKAGSYAIQGAGGMLIDHIDGDYTTVVGLPLRLVANLLRSASYSVPVNVEELYQRKPYANWCQFVA